MTFDLSRRAAMTVALTAGAALVTQGCATAQQASTPPAAGRYQPVPLPFDPKTIPGFSERILVSHHDNNYVGAINRLGAIETEMAKLDIATAPGFMINGLKREELLAMNSMILHEAYFNSLGAGGTKPGALLWRSDRKGLRKRESLARSVRCDGQGSRRRLRLGTAQLVSARRQAGEPVGS